MELIKYNELPAVDKPVLIRCAFSSCKSRIIPLNTVKNNLVTIENSPELLTTDSADQRSSSEKFQPKNFYRVNDPWDFDNMGVSRQADMGSVLPSLNEKEIRIERYLICADCDRGPIGFAGFLHDTEGIGVDNLTYFLSCESVLYDVKQ